MNTLAICIAGIIFLFIFSFLFSFYHDLLRIQRIRKERKKRFKSRLSNANENAHKAALKIPGYYEELSKRSKKEERYAGTHTTII